MKNNVTRIIAMLLVCCMLFGLTACGKQEIVVNNGNASVSNNNNQSKPEDFVVNEQPATNDEEKEVVKNDAVANDVVVNDVVNNTVVKDNVVVKNDKEIIAEENSVSVVPENNAGANVLGGVNVKPEVEVNNTNNEKVEQDNVIQDENVSVSVPVGEYNEGVVLVKVANDFDAAALGNLNYTSVEPLYKGSKWYGIQLAESVKTVDAVTYLRGLEAFEKVDYDYVMGVTDKPEDNPNYKDQVNLGLSNIPYGWTQNGKAPGGSPDVVVAVIDTGVDYNHLDLRNNIWINYAEIPDNGKDDDGNGYVDDVYGWDCVGNDNNPIDDNGHGTHVAGIIAAENNKQGGIGVAYNCKVMVLKAGNSSGYFNNSDIAEAIQYAYMNGASVINMSFGGSFISIAVEEALENAYNSCVLVAAAGNDGACNNLSCEFCDVIKISYPAALPYVIGVMSTDKNGSHVSSFSNYDHNPYDSIEYEVFAVGEGVGSTWPSDKYACLNGTSMAAPTVAGIAALLRSTYSDREVYSTKFIQSQIVNTGTVNPYNTLLKETDDAHSVADVQEALTKLPKPAVNLYDYSIDDSVSISSKNNGNGVIDAGETVRLYISLHNRGGVASNVNVSIDTYRSEIGDETMTDPYFTFVNPTMQLSDIGTYSVRESGDKYFEIVVDANCPNDYLVNFNIRFTYTNGLDTEDKTVYEDDGRQQAQFNVSSGYHLPSIINEDTVFTNDRLYIVGEDVMITAGVTVTFEEGCRIQFYDDSEYYNSPAITVYGTLIFNGTQDKMITMNPSERHATFACPIYVKSGGSLNLDYVDSINLYISEEGSMATSVVINSILKVDGKYYMVYNYTGGRITTDLYYPTMDKLEGCYVDLCRWNSMYKISVINDCYIHITSDNAVKVSKITKFTNNILYSEFLNHSDVRVLEFEANSIVENNIFLSSNDDDIRSFIPIKFGTNSTILNNTFSAGYRENANQIIANYLGSDGQPTIDVFGSCSDTSVLYPHIESVEIFNADDEQITTIGKEEIKVRVTFNRPMDMSKAPSVTFGTIEPFADYKINGDYVSETVWEGTYALKAQIENGQNFLKVKGACAADDATKVVRGENQLYEFTIDTTTAMSMSLFAAATDNGIELTWVQDDYDTLMGYNIYRSTSKDGNYVKINPSVILSTESSFIDENAEPGKTYWYTFTVVLSDFSESAPAGKVYCTAVDTLNPSVYHTPVNQGYQNNNLVISCTASDNMKIASVTLYYRTVGATEWKSLTMSKVNDKYSATVFGSELTLEGLEYYVVASDGSNTVNKGTAEEPYFVVIKDASAISRKGDVDGNGVVDTKDALMIMQCINGDFIMTDDEFKRADLNKDGELSSVEALRILQYINGNVSTLDM